MVSQHYHESLLMSITICSVLIVLMEHQISILLLLGEIQDFNVLESQRILTFFKPAYRDGLVMTFPDSTRDIELGTMKDNSHNHSQLNMEASHVMKNKCLLGRGNATKINWLLIFIMFHAYLSSYSFIMPLKQLIACLKKNKSKHSNKSQLIANAIQSLEA